VALDPNCEKECSWEVRNVGEGELTVTPTVDCPYSKITASWYPPDPVVLKVGNGERSKKVFTLVFEAEGDVSPGKYVFSAHFTRE